jgi:acetyl esterase/lipase
MTTSHAATNRRSTVHRVADLHLRGRAGSIRSRAYWPAPADPTRPPALLLCFAAEPVDALCRWFCAAAGVVALAVACRPASQDVFASMEWAGDHATDLAADPGRLLVAGERAGAGLAVTAALHARDHGWPPLHRQVLIRPVLDASLLAGPLAGLAPATLVTGERDDGGRYAARLRLAGVPVEELPDPDLGGALRLHLQDNQKG